MDADVHASMFVLVPPRDGAPSFVRETLSKLSADTDRSETNSPSRSPKFEGSWLPSAESSPSNARRGDLPPIAAIGDKVSCVRTSESGLTDRIHMRGVFANDLERHRGAMVADMSQHLAAMKDTLKEAGAIGVGETISEMRQRESESQRECQRLRDHCEELLRLNSQLRQQQVDALTNRCQQYATCVQQLTPDIRTIRDLLQPQSEVVDRTEKQTSKLLNDVADLRFSMSEFIDRCREGLAVDIERIMHRTLEVHVAPLRADHQRLQEKVTQAVTLLVNSQAAGERQAKRYEELASQVASNIKTTADEYSASLRNFELIKRNRDTANKSRELVNQNEHQIADRQLVLEQRKLAAEAEQARIYQEQVDALREKDLADEKLEELTRQIEVASSAGNSQFGDLHSQLDNVKQDAKVHELRLAELEGAKQRCEHDLAAVVTDLDRSCDAAKQEFLEMDAVAEQKMYERLDGLADMLRGLHATLDDRAATELELKQCRKDMEGLRTSIAHVFHDQLKRCSKIERRGNLRVNLKTGEVAMLRAIPFVPKHLKDGAIAEYADDELATTVLRDVAELWKLFQGVLIIEGYANDAGESDARFWSELAAKRASLCASTLSSMGVDSAKLVSLGKPGSSANDEAEVVVKLSIIGEDEE